MAICTLIAPLFKRNRAEHEAHLLLSLEAVRGDADFDAMRYHINDLSRITSHGLRDDIQAGLEAPR